MVRGRVVVVAGGVMPTQGDGNAVCKAKDHSRDSSVIENAWAKLDSGDELAREGEPDALKDACPVREGLH